MAKKEIPLESTLYSLVGRWLTRHFKCFKIAVNKDFVTGE
jgi:hypothetical protein